MRRRYATALTVAGIAFAFAGASALPAGAEMRTTEINGHLCKTVGGGKFVKIPGFPGERIDKRLRPDIKWMKRKYDIFITDGYAPSGHAANGEHPIGLAADIISGGGWGKIDKLAERFEPRQNKVRPPMRWVGYNGDSGHGRGNHLHLSWSHSDNTRPEHPARVVYTRVCPGDGGGGGTGGGGTGGGGVGHKTRASGKLTPAEIANMAPAVPETDEHDHNG